MPRKMLEKDLGTKQPYEVLDWLIRLKRELDGRTITAIESAEVVRVDAEEEPAELVINQPPEVPTPVIVEAGTAVQFWTGAGTAPGRYKITFQLTASDGVLQIELDCTLAVRAQ